MTKVGLPARPVLSTWPPFTPKSTNSGIDVPSGTIVDSTAMSSSDVQQSGVRNPVSVSVQN